MRIQDDAGCLFFPDTHLWVAVSPERAPVLANAVSGLKSRYGLEKVLPSFHSRNRVWLRTDEYLFFSRLRPPPVGASFRLASTDADPRGVGFSSSRIPGTFLPVSLAGWSINFSLARSMKIPRTRFGVFPPTTIPSVAWWFMPFTFSS